MFNLVGFLRLGLYISAFIPLIYSMELISPFTFVKTLVFRSLIEVLGVAYLILILKDRSYLPDRQAGLPRRDKIFWALLIFTFVFTITTFTSVNEYLSFWGNLERMGGLWTFWHYFLFFIMLTSVFEKKHWQKFFNISIFAAILSALYGFGQRTDFNFFIGSGGRERIFGTLGNAGLFAGYELFFVFLSLMMMLQRNNTKNQRVLYFLAFVISSIAVLMTAVRGAILGYGIGLMIFSFLWARSRSPRLGRIVLGGFLIAITLFVVFSLTLQDSALIKESRYLSRITSLSLTSPTVQNRAWAWQAGLNGWNDNIKTTILGYGPETYNVPFSKYFNPKIYTGVGSETLFDRAHNMFVEILVTMGIIGLLAYVNIFKALFSYLRDLLNKAEFAEYSIALIALLAAYIIHVAFFFDATANSIVLFSVFAFVSFLHGPGKREQASAVNKRILSSINFNILALFLVILVSVLIYKTNILPLKANYATTRAIIRTWHGDVDGAFTKFKEALSYEVPGKYEFRHRFAQYLIGTQGPSVREEKVRKAYEIALDGIDKNIAENPMDYLPYLYGSRLNILLAIDDPKSPYLDKALSYSAKALEISPTFLRTYHEIAQTYLAKEDYDKVIEYFQRAVDLNPDVGVSYWYLGSAKLEKGDISGINDIEKASQVLYSHKPNEQEYLRLAQVYLSLNNYEKIVEIYQVLTELNGTDPKYWAGLATAYAKIKKYDDAEKATRKAVELDPSFESDARIFLRSIGREF